MDSIHVTNYEPNIGAKDSTCDRYAQYAIR